MNMPFDTLVRRAHRVITRLQNRLPPQIAPLARCVPVHYERIPSESLLAEGFEPDILGLFSGNPYGSEYAQSEPDPPQIILYLEALWDFAEGDPHTFSQELRTTYLHELGHYLGWDEGQVEARGL